MFWYMCVAGSNCSSGSEGEVTTLQAGICVKQLCVSIKDTIIAREALSLLVTCLQLRSQQLCKKNIWVVRMCFWNFWNRNFEVKSIK